MLSVFLILILKAKHLLYVLGFLMKQTWFCVVRTGMQSLVQFVEISFKISVLRDFVRLNNFYNLPRF